jgi:hypothetical protein
LFLAIFITGHIHGVPERTRTLLPNGSMAIYGQKMNNPNEQKDYWSYFRPCYWLVLAVGVLLSVYGWGWPFFFMEIFLTIWAFPLAGLIYWMCERRQ